MSDLGREALSLLEVVARSGDRWSDLAERAVTRAQLRGGFRPSANMNFDEAVSALERTGVLRREADQIACEDCEELWEPGGKSPDSHDTAHRVHEDILYRLQLGDLEREIARGLVQSWGDSAAPAWSTRGQERVLVGSMRDSAYQISFFPRGQIQEQPGTLIAVPERRDAALPEVFWLDVLRPERADDLRRWVRMSRVWALQDWPAPRTLPKLEEALLGRSTRRYMAAVGGVPRALLAHEVPALEAVAATARFEGWTLGTATIVLCTTTGESLPSRWLVLSGGTHDDRARATTALEHLRTDVTKWLDRRGRGALLFALFSDAKTIIPTLGISGVSAVLTFVPRTVAELTGPLSFLTTLSLIVVTAFVAAVVAYALWLTLALSYPFCAPKVGGLAHRPHP